MNIKLATGESIPAAAGESILSALKRRVSILFPHAAAKAHAENAA